MREGSGTAGGEDQAVPTTDRFKCGQGQRVDMEAGGKSKGTFLALRIFFFLNFSKVLCIS